MCPLPRKQQSYTEDPNFSLFLNPSLQKTFLEVAKNPARTDQIASLIAMNKKLDTAVYESVPVKNFANSFKGSAANELSLKELPVFNKSQLL